MTDRREFAAFLRRMRTLALVIAGVILLGTLGLMATEGVGVWRGFIWTLDIVATVGSIPAPATTAGQVVKVALIVLGVGTLFYGLVTVTEVFVSGHLAELLHARRRRALRGHRPQPRDARARPGHRRALHRGRAVRRRGAARGGGDAGAWRHRLRRLRRRQHLHHPDRPRPAPRRRDRRARVRGVGRGEAPAGGRDARDLAVQDE